MPKCTVGSSQGLQLYVTIRASLTVGLKKAPVNNSTLESHHFQKDKIAQTNLAISSALRQPSIIKIEHEHTAAVWHFVI